MGGTGWTDGCDGEGDLRDKRREPFHVLQSKESRSAGVGKRKLFPRLPASRVTGQ